MRRLAVRHPLPWRGPTLAEVEPGGTVDADTGQWVPRSDLSRAIWYLTRLAPTG